MAKTNNQLNANTTSQKGLEKAIGNILRFVTSAQSKTNALLYGKGSTKNPNAINRALDRGIIPALEDLSSVDFCNVINYLISQSGNKPTFNPNKRPEGGFELDKWNIQNEAFQAQLAIDNYFGRFSGALSPNSINGLIDLLGILNPSILKILGSDVGINSGPFQKAFPQTKIVAQALTKASNFFNSTLSSIGSELSISQAQKAIDLIQKIRAGLILIQGLNSPANILAAADLALGGRVQSEIARINRLIPVDKLIPFLKSVLKTANNINSIGRKILSLIDTSKFFVRLILLIIKALTILKNVLLFVPLPNIFTTLGITTKVANTLEEFLNRRGVITLTQRLRQLNYVLNVMSIFVTSLVAGMNEIIIRLRLILLNIQSCQNQNIANLDPALQQDIINTIDSLSSTRDTLQKFLDDYNNAKKSTQTTFGEYTIEIITEQVTDEGISLKRRYGIARNNQNVIVVQSLPTFASLDLIIINEVKVLLVSKGLVLQGASAISTEDAAVIVESLNYLGDSDITLDNLQTEAANISLALEESDSELELGKFVSNLPGGRALRKKVREKLIKTNETLIKNLKSTDPNSTYTKSIVKDKQAETAKLKIEKLEEQKQDLKKSLLLTGGVPGSSIAIIAKIKAIDQEIKDLKNSLK